MALTVPIYSLTAKVSITLTLILRALPLSLLAAPVLLATPIAAQQAVRTACWSDIERLCPAQLAERDRDAIRACLRSRIAEASNGCRTAIRAQVAADRRAQSGNTQEKR